MRYTIFLVAATALAAPVPQADLMNQVGQLMYGIPVAGPMVASMMGAGQGGNKQGGGGGMMGLGNMMGMFQGMPVIGNLMGGGNGGMGGLMNMGGLLGGAPAPQPAPAAKSP